MKKSYVPNFQIEKYLTTMFRDNGRFIKPADMKQMALQINVMQRHFYRSLSVAKNSISHRYHSR